MRKALTTLAAALVLAAPLASLPASANSVTTTDAGDGRGPLTIAKVQTGHARYYPTLTITFDKPIDPRKWGPRDFVVVAVDTDGRGKNEQWIYIHRASAQSRRLYTSSYDPHTKWWDYDGAKLKRLSPRSLKLTMENVWSTEGHLFAVGSFRKDGGMCSRGCWDALPERGWLAHDNMPPALYHLKHPEWAFDGLIPISWRYEDDGFSGLERSTLFASELGSDEWKVAGVSRLERRKEVAVPAAPEGTQMIFRIHARDGNGNEAGTGVLGTRVPMDETYADGNPVFLGLWLEQSAPDAYGGSVRVSTTSADSFTFGGYGDIFCVIMRATEAEGTFSLDEGGGTFFSPWDQGGGRHIQCTPTTLGDHTATLEVDSGSFAVDGYWVGLNYPALNDAVKRPLPETPGRHGGAASDGSSVSLDDLLGTAGDLPLDR